MTPIVPDKPMLRVAHVVLQLDRGGMEKLLVDYARHTDCARFDLRFISLTGRGSVAEEIEACGWPVTAINEPPGIRPGLVLKLARLFRQWNVDIMHAHNTKPLLYGGPAARLARVPSAIYTCHGQRYGASRADTLLFVQMSRLIDRVVCVSEESSQSRVREGVPERKVSTIWNGIDLSRFAYQAPQPGAPAVLVARLRPEKDVETLLRATAIMVQKHPSFRLEIAGDGIRFNGLRQMSRELNLEQHVRFLGEVRDIPELLGRGSMLVLSSLGEGLSVSVMEAMARGLPVVATRVGGNPEIIVEGETGLLVPTADPSRLADAMMRVWCDPDLGRRMGLAGRRRVEEHFDVRRMVANYETIYDELGRHPGRCAAGQSARQVL